MNYLEQIAEEAIAAYPNEGVWLITEQGVMHVENTHDDPTNFFSVSFADTLAANKQGLLKVVHSHCDQPAVPSQADMYTQQLMGVPWGVLSTNGTTASPITWWGDEEIPALEGRSFIHGVSDCYSLVRDYYRLKGIDLADVPRDWEWWEDSSLLVDSFAALGFKPVTAAEATAGDTWVSQVRTSTPHHCGILLDNDLILHHPGSSKPIDLGKLSVVEPIYRHIPYIVMYLRLS